jgi:hypothetical protein
VDDVDANRAFPEWVGVAAPRFSSVVKKSHAKGAFGAAIF